jgi:hypothetical protein
MSFATGLIKTAINCTPKMMAMWVANIMLKGIANISDYELDLDARKAYVQTTLYGESESIDVWLDGFAVTDEDGVKYFILQQGRSNRPWLTNIFERISGKAWKIPVIPQYKRYLDLIAELLQAEQIETQSEEI